MIVCFTSQTRYCNAVWLLCSKESQLVETVGNAVTIVEHVMSLCATDSHYKAVKLEVKGAVHLGPAPAAVLGVQRPKYTIFGTTVDILTALLHLSLPMSVLLSPNVVEPLQV
jgi:class 3 adenylate cyclase